MRAPAKKAPTTPAMLMVQSSVEVRSRNASTQVLQLKPKKPGTTGEVGKVRRGKKKRRERKARRRGT
eukprot:374035-Pelagomonas_calceolata.AAC.6